MATSTMSAASERAAAARPAVMTRRCAGGAVPGAGPVTVNRNACRVRELRWVDTGTPRSGERDGDSRPCGGAPSRDGPPPHGLRRRDRVEGPGLRRLVGRLAAFDAEAGQPPGPGGGQGPVHLSAGGPDGRGPHGADGQGGAENREGHAPAGHFCGGGGGGYRTGE